jgi:hypothetical protein
VTKVIPVNANCTELFLGTGAANFLWGLLGGVVAWTFTTFVAQPFTAYRSLRARVIEELARYEDRLDPNPDLDPPTDARLAARKKAYEDCGTALVAFAVSNRYVTCVLHRFPIKRLRRYPRSAGLSLQTLGDAKLGSQAADQLRNQVDSALKLRFWP